MAGQASAVDVRTALSDALGSGGLPPNLQPNAEAMLAKLNKPVRVTVMGLPNTGKSQLLNLLAGEIVIPEGVHLPTTQLVFGETTQSKCTMPDGTVQVLDHCDANAIAQMGPVFVQLELPLAALKRISILEVVASDDHIDQQRAMQWATKRTDVALWCTHTFNIPEQTLWGAVPDIIKDHGFMVVTKADILNRNDLLDSTLANVKNVAEHEFNQILPISTLSALGARSASGQIDKDALRRAGGLALISAILRQVELGQQATVDQATVLLRQLASAKAATPKKIESAAEKSKVRTHPIPVEDAKPAAVPVPETKAAPEPEIALEPKVSPKPNKKADKAVGDEFPAPLPPRKKSKVVIPKLKEGSRDAVKEAIGHLTREGRALAKAVEAADTVPVAKVMSRSVENVQWLADHLQDNGESDDQVLDRARNSAIDAADLIQLMQLEKQESAVLDAVSLVVQLKHELEADLAA